MRKFWGYSFDVKIYDLSISDAFRAFGTWQILFPTPTMYCEGTKTCSKPWISLILTVSAWGGACPGTNVELFLNFFFSKKKWTWKNRFFSWKNRSSKKWFWIFFLEKFSFFFDRSQKIYFSELKKKVEYSFDVKNYDLSISEVFSAIAALLDGFWSCFLSKL